MSNLMDFYEATQDETTDEGFLLHTFYFPAYVGPSLLSRKNKYVFSFTSGYQTQKGYVTITINGKEVYIELHTHRGTLLVDPDKYVYVAITPEHAYYREWLDFLFSAIPRFKVLKNVYHDLIKDIP